MVQRLSDRYRTGLKWAGVVLLLPALGAFWGHVLPARPRSSWQVGAHACLH